MRMTQPYRPPSHWDANRRAHQVNHAGAKCRVIDTRDGSVIHEQTTRAIAEETRDMFYREMAVRVEIQEIDVLTKGRTHRPFVTDIIAESSETFSHDMSHDFTHDPQFPLSTPAISDNDWKTRLAHKKSRASFRFEQKIVETRIESFIDEKVYYDFLLRIGYSVIDGRTMQIVGSGTKENCKAYIRQAIARRGNHLEDYRVVKFRQRDLYRARTKRYGFVLRYKGDVICIGSRAEISHFLKTRKINDLREFGRITRYGA